MNRPNEASDRRAVAAWLLLCCALVACMVVVGGITRLTQSGLSIVEWEPLKGAIPPLSQAHWEELFGEYRQTPQYLKVNRGMSLEEFKGIFWWEYIHRLLGRVVGLAFFLPMVWFMARGQVRGPLAWRLAGLFVLGGLQGALGWYMVKSGLVDDPRVSQYRLAAHLGLAFAIYGAMLWTALGLLHPGGAPPVRPRLRRAGLGLLALVFAMVLSGALVAGLHAGRAYNTFPLMNGHWVPPELFMLEPRHLNFFENMATVQFDHRLIAWLLAILVPVFRARVRRCAGPRARLGADLLLVALVVQFALGVSTLLLAVPVSLAVAHQAGALAVFTAALFTAHALAREPAPVPAAKGPIAAPA